MLYTALTKKAILLCFEAHAGQLDKSGLPYVLHPLHLAEQMPDEVSAAVALLHDVVEDTPCTLDKLRELGFPDEVLAAVDLLTHRKGVPYMDYVAAIRPNPVARRVKIADLQHNSDLTRIEKVTDKDLARVRKYQKALRLLTEPQELPPELLPARQVPCCGIIVRAESRFCPCCGNALPPAEEVMEAPFDPEETIWLCFCGNNESANHRFCSRCGRRMGFSESVLRPGTEDK